MLTEKPTLTKPRSLPQEQSNIQKKKSQASEDPAATALPSRFFPII